MWAGDIDLLYPIQTQVICPGQMRGKHLSLLIFMEVLNSKACLLITVNFSTCFCFTLGFCYAGRNSLNTSLLKQKRTQKKKTHEYLNKAFYYFNFVQNPCILNILMGNSIAILYWILIPTANRVHTALGISQLNMKEVACG